jgi:hypothetical protein
VQPFQNLLKEYVHQNYREEEYGAGEDHWAAQPLFDTIQADWQVFAETAALQHARDLLADVLSSISSSPHHLLTPDTKVLALSRFARFTAHGYWDRIVATALSSQEEVASVDDIKSRMSDLGEFENMIGSFFLTYFTSKLPAGSLLFRARIGPQYIVSKHVPPYIGSDISANPAHPASRANTDGQPNLLFSVPTHVRR